MEYIWSCAEVGLIGFCRNMVIRAGYVGTIYKSVNFLFLFLFCVIKMNI